MNFKLKTSTRLRARAFTLIETVIAIGVLAVLLTAFMLVFTPAADGIRKSINVQLADRMASTLESELALLRVGEENDGAKIYTGFDKAYKWINDSMKTSNPEAVFVYQYRGDLSKPLRADGTLQPFPSASKGVNGEDYTVVTMARRRVAPSGTATDTNFKDDLTALEGRVFAVKLTQLIFSGSAGLIESTKGKVTDPTPPEVDLTVLPGDTKPGISATYPEGAIAFSASFYGLPSSSYAYLGGTGGGAKFEASKLKNPYFTRNLAVRR